MIDGLFSRRLLLGAAALGAASLPARAEAVTPLSGVSPVSFPFESAGGRITAEFYPGSGSGPRPGVVLLHGIDGLRLPERYRIPARLLAAQGFGALIVPYFESRAGGASWGEGWAGIRAREGAWRQVVRDALTALGDRPDIDEKRLALVGFSLGGRVALGVANEDKRVRALVDLFAPLPDGFESSLKRLPPTLILHGTEDRVVPVSQSQTLVSLMQARGLPHRVRYFEGQGHGLYGAAQMEAGLLTVGFLREQLG